MSKRQIIIDFDSTMADTIMAMCQYYNIKYYSHKGFKRADARELSRWDGSDQMPLMHKGEINTLFETELFWDSLMLMDEHVIPFFNKYRDRLTICTLGTHINIRKKIKWIQNNLGSFAIVPIINDGLSNIKQCKQIINMNGAIFIDDNIKILDSTNADIKICFAGYGLGKEWNKGVEGKYQVVNTFDQLDKLIQEIDENL